MAEDSDKKPGKIIKDGQKEQKKSQSKIASGTTATAEGIKALTKKTEAANRKQEALLQVAKGRETIADLEYQATMTGNKELLEYTAEYTKKLNDQERFLKMSNDISESHVDRLDEIKLINDSSDDLLSKANEQRAHDISEKERKDKKEQERSDEFAGVMSEGFRGLVDEMKLNTKSMEVNDDAVEKAINNMGPLFAGEVDPFFQEANDRLDKIKDLEQKGLITQETSNKMRQELIDATQDREKEREAQKTAELQAMGLTKIGEAIGGLGEKLGNFGQSAVKTGGLLAGLMGLVIGVVDPELLSQIIQDFVTGFLEIVEGLVAFVTGDFETAKQKIGDNILLFGGLVLGLALYFGGPLITAFGGIFTKLAKVVQAIKVFRTFMLGLFTPTMLSTLGSMLAGLGAVLVPLLPIVAVIAVIAGAFMYLKSTLGEGATVMDTLKLGALYLIDGLSMLVNGITFLPRKIFEFLGGGRLARWLFGDEVGDMVDQFLGEGLETGRAGKFKEETKARLAQEKRDKELQEQAEAEGITDLPEGIEIPDVTTGTDLTALGDETSAAQIAATGGAGGTQVMGANITNNTSSQAATTIMAVQPNPSRLALEGVTGR